MQSFETETATIDAWKAAIENPAPQWPVKNSVNQPDKIGPRRFMNADQSAIPDIANTEVKHHVTDPLNDSLVAAQEDNCTNII